MKPFDIEAAQRGEPILLMLASEYDTTSVRLVGMLTDGRHVVERRAESGVYYVEVATEHRLRMAPKKRTVWINLHKQRDTGDITPFLYGDEAYANRQRGNSMNCLGTFPIEIED
jgi:hypothetical protein